MEDFDSQWAGILGDEEIDFHFKHIIVNFFRIDNISLMKYKENLRANEICKEGGLSNWERAQSYSAFKEDKVNCTKTFREYFSENILKRSPNVPEWFYIAYPDVEIWFHKRLSHYGKIIAEREQEFFIDGIANLKLYRFIINEYLKTNKKLECSLDSND